MRFLLIKKEKVLLTMKCVAALFLAFMLTKSVKFITEMPYENFEQNNEDKEENCNRYWLFLVYAFVLGAFWNVKKLRQIGIV